jgi:flagellin-specific chaperone FliS
LGFKRDRFLYPQVPQEVRMGFFSRKRFYTKQELELIEKIEKRLAGLIKEWDESYEKQDFLFEYNYENFAKGIIRYINHELSPHLHLIENEPKPGNLIILKENKAYKKLWKEMVKLYKQIPLLIKKGEISTSLRLLYDKIDLFERKVVNLRDEEVKRWDSRLRGLYEYLSGKGVANLTLPVNKYDKRRIIALYRWEKIDSKSMGIEEARELVKEAEFLKKNRLRISERILLICKVMRKDIHSLF